MVEERYDAQEMNKHFNSINLYKRNAIKKLSAKHNLEYVRHRNSNKNINERGHANEA